MKADVKITVLKRTLNRDVAGKYMDPEDSWGPCGQFKEGQEFIIEGTHLTVPPGFCSWAWVDMQKYVMALARGANFLGMKQGVFVTACSDGFRPVIFKLERL